MNYLPEEHISTIMTPRRRITYMNNPVRFVTEIIFNENAKMFGGELEVSEQQVEMLMAIAHNRRVSAKAGRGVGKTSVLAWLIIWWLCMFEGGQVVATAPSFPQLSSVLWPEVSKWLKVSLVKDFFVHTAKKVYLKTDPKNTFAEPRTASKEESAQGLHEEHLLILLDEAPGIEDNIWDVMQGSLTKPNNKVIAMGNPARTSGFFFDAFHKDKKIWKQLTFNAEESPNVSIEWLEEMREKYVRGEVVHDMYKIHVLGEFPSGDPDAFIALADVNAAQYRELEMGEPIEIGVDVARKGDDLTVIATRYGNYIDDLITMGKTTTDQVVDAVLDHVDAIRLATGYQDIIRVKVDDTGVGGGVTDYLDLDEDHDIEVVPCNFGGKGDTVYNNEASKMWGTFKDMLPDLHLPNNRFLIEELATRKWEPDASGRIKIQPKKEFKKDFGSSPDHADAVILCTADKENELRLIKSYNYATNGLVFYAQDLMHGDMYASLFLNRKGKLSAVFCTYTGTELRVFDEYEGDSSDILHIIQGYGHFKKVIGNKFMFHTGSDDIFLNYSSSGIFISESYGYDEYGATRTLEALAARGGLITAVECTTTANQLRTWSIKDDTHQKKEEYGMCMALLHVISELTSENAIIHNDSVMDHLAYIDENDPNTGFLAM